MTHGTDEPDKLVCGTFRDEQGVVLWRVWAPHCDPMQLVLYDRDGTRAYDMRPVGWGYFELSLPDVVAGQRYAYRLPDGAERPDPASRWQPEGVHRSSALYFPQDFDWQDGNWPGIPLSEVVIYELHVGTFTSAGTLRAASQRFSELAALGVTAIEVMPLAQFPGGRNWGYDGVHPYAVQHTYGGPEAFQAFVDTAHAHGLAVILDVVYNHLGPEGNYLGAFGPYFTDRYGTPWGQALNYDGADSDAVRRFVIENACMWIRDFHVDGLRLDAVHSIFDFGARHILAELQSEVQHIAREQKRHVQVFAESDQNDVRWVRPAELGGHGLDGVWSDDFHHSVHALLTGEKKGYYSDYGAAEDLARAFSEVFVYDGRYSSFRRKRYGSATGKLPRQHFVVCVQNHDQVGNRALGDRLGTLVSPAAQRLAAALLLLHPGVPLLFMGEEYGETRPFPYFCSFADPSLIEAVRQGRRAEFAAFGWEGDLPDPQAESTFGSAQLSWQWEDDALRQGLRRLYGDLLQARRDWPALAERHVERAWIERDREATEGSKTTLLVVDLGTEVKVRLVANLTDAKCAWPALERENRSCLFSSEWTQYGGELGDALPRALGPYECRVFGPDEYRR